MFLLGSCGHGGHEHSHHHDHEEIEEHEHGHDHDHLQHHDGDEHEEDEHNHSDEITLSHEKAEAAGLRVETVERTAFRGVIRGGGRLLSAQGEETTLVASAAGTVHFANKFAEGSALGKEQKVVTISSENLKEGSTVERARIAYQTAKDEYERAARLAESKIVAQKELARAKEAYDNARLTYEALRPAEDGKSATVVSPIGGYVKACYVGDGDYVTEGQPLMSVTQTRRLQLKAELSERYYAKLKDISSANFKTTYDNKVYALDSLGGRLISFGKAASGETYTLPVVFEFDNRGDILPGSFVEVYLLTGKRSGVISVPVEALTEEQGVNFVYLQLDEDGYKKQEVKLGMTDGSRVEILSGLNVGDRLVTHGAVHVRMAAASNTIPGHTHNH